MTPSLMVLGGLVVAMLIAILLTDSSAWSPKEAITTPRSTWLMVGFALGCCAGGSAIFLLFSWRILP